jgi:hypothetical protein
VIEFLRYFRPLILAYVAVKAVQVFLYPDPYLISDTEEYLSSAISGRANPYKPFGYSTFLALTRPLLPFPIALPVMQALIRLAAVLLLGHVLRRHTRLPRWAVLGAGFGVGLDPLALLMDHHLLADSLFISGTVGFVAGLVAYLRRPGWAWLAVALGFALMCVSLRFAALPYPLLLVIAVLARARRVRWVHALTAVVGTALLILGLSLRVKRDLGVFAFTTFDGWAFYGNLAPLLALEAGREAPIDDPETRLVWEYFASFPPEIYARHDTDWHRWHSLSPAKQLLYTFTPRLRPAHTDSATRSRGERFLSAFSGLARHPATGAQRFFRAHRDSLNPDAPYSLRYPHAFVLTNEFLRRLNREFIRRHATTYATRFFLGSFARVIVPTELLGGGRYSYRSDSDRAVEAFWRGADSSTWRPRLGDVAAAFRKWPERLIAVEWLLSGTALAAALIRRRGAAPPWRGSHTEAGVFLLAFALGTGMAVAFGHMTEVRYVAPIVPFLLVATGLFAAPDGEGVSTSPWIRTDRPRRLKRVVVVAGAALVLLVSVKVVLAVVNERRPDTLSLALEWIADHDGPGALVAIERTTEDRFLERDRTPALKAVTIPVDVIAPEMSDPFYDARWFVNADYIVLDETLAERCRDEPERFGAQLAFRDSLRGWRDVAAFASKAGRGPDLRIVGNPAPADRRVDHSFAPGRFAAFATVPRGVLLDFLGALADAYVSRGWRRGALDLYHHMTRLYPDEEQAFYNYGTVALMLERYEEAAGAIERAIELQPDRVESHNNLGVARFNLGDLDGAEAAFREALRRDPAHESARRNLEALRGR